MPLEATKVLRTPFYDDVPRAYVRNGQNISDATLFGPYAQTIWNFANRHHMILECNRDLSENYSEIYERIHNGEYNLAMNGATLVNHVTLNVRFSYPLYWVKNCVMVPLEDELPKYWYIVWPFGRYIYMCILFGIFYIAFLMNSAIIMFSSNMNVQLKNAHVRVLFFYMLLFVFGFILAAYHAPYLTAYNMKPVFVPPINTVDDLLNANIRVLITLSDFAEIKHSGVENILALSRLLREIP
ncbi:unnamed protein product [Ceratitis capitata]|uniref:(Mediterranean fruit fly) hypothetical protein n=1 Tax=Ceratitis capitata TaxID=7213 RepID=A0A811V7Q3_CERCA|nr:unnamed protein product [Ceratitis capitata]